MTIRTETPLGGGYSSYNVGGAAASYSYIRPEKTTIYVGLSSFIPVGNDGAFLGRMSLSDDSEDVDILDKNTQEGVSPRLNAYVEHHLPHKQTVVTDATAISLLAPRSITSKSGKHQN